MPVFCIEDRLCYFAHVPKCAGSAIERYLNYRFGTVGFINTEFTQDEDRPQWSKSSPQHIDTAALERILPRSFFQHCFGVVRHPEPRILSVFQFQRDIEQRLPIDMTLERFLAELETNQSQDPFYLDNHPRKMTDLVPENSTVFRLEDGLEAVTQWLDQITGNTRGPRSIPRENSWRDVVYQRKLVPGPEVVVTPAIREMISEIYAEDFERFGYAPMTDTEGTGE